MCSGLWYYRGNPGDFLQPWTRYEPYQQFQGQNIKVSYPLLERTSTVPKPPPLDFETVWNGCFCQIQIVLTIVKSKSDAFFCSCFSWTFLIFVCLNILFIMNIYFHSARPLGQAESWYWCVCLSVCLSPPQKPGPLGTLWITWTFRYHLNTLDL